MSLRAFLVVTGIVFAAVAAMHACRIVVGWPAVLGSTAVPMTVSWVGLVVAGLLSFEAFRHARRS
jgi:uncharacterized membrane protein